MRAPWTVALLLAFVPLAAAQEKPAARPRVVIEPGGHSAKVVCLFFSPDSTVLITVSQDQTIRYWHAGTAELRAVLRMDCRIDGRNVAVASNARALALPGQPGTILVVSIVDGSARLLRPERLPPITALAFSRDGTHLAVGGDNHEAFAVDVRTGKRMAGFEMSAPVAQVGFTPDGKRLTALAGAVGESGSIGVLDLATNTKDTEVIPARALCFAWSPDGKTLAIGKPNGIELWDPATKRMLKRIETGRTTSLTFLSGGDELLATGTRPKGAGVNLFDARTGNEIRLFEQSAPAIPSAAAVSPDGKLVAAVSGERDVGLIWRKSDGKQLNSFAGRGAPHYGAGWSPDGQAIAWGNARARSTDYHERRPLEGAFDLAELQFVARPDFKAYRRAVQKLGDDTLTTVASSISVSRNGKEYVLGTHDPAGSRGGTLLPDGRAVVAMKTHLSYYDLKVGAVEEKGKNRYVIPDDKALDATTLQDVIWDVAPSPDNRYVLTASVDQVLRVWKVNPKKLHLLLSLFVAERDWVAWTPEGYYAASPGGERLVGWQIDNGPDKPASVYPAAQFRASLYRPDVIKLLLKEGNLKRALAAADKKEGTATSTAASVEEVLPPVVVVTAEAKGDTAEVRFVARPAGKQPITAARLMVNGRPYPGKDRLKTYDPPRAGEVRDSWTIRLAPGENRIAVRAETTASKGISEPVVVKLSARGMVRDDAPPEEARKALSSLYVLVVGVSKYKQGKLDLNYAAADANAIAEAFEKHSSNKDLYKQVKVLPQLTDNRATRRAILDGLGTLRKEMTQNDVGVVFFAGHGAKDHAGKFYLMPWDVEPDNLLATGVPGDQLKSELASIPGRFVVMLDACHSGGIDGGGRRAAALTDDLARDLAADDFGVIVMCSAMGREFALEDAKLKHGYFTMALVEGLSGKAHKSSDGGVYIHHLNAYVTDRVKELSRGQQHPVTPMPGTVRSFPLSKP